MKIPRILIAAPASGSGKTAISCGLMCAFRERGMGVRACKCGPDYIDPMFHREVLGVDASQLAVDQAEANARLNHLEERVKFLCEDVFELLPELEEREEKYDVVILDPPAFTKSRNSVKNAVKGYREINLRALKLVKDGGFLATCSCSHFMTYELFTKTIAQAARSAHRRLRQVEYRTQAPDHPILWAADESYYLKFYIFQVCEEK